MIVILQGFGPDWEIEENPSQQIVEAIASKPSGDIVLVPTIWPNSFDVVRADIPRLMSEYSPDVWIGLGAAKGRPALSIERLAVNMLDFPYPDHDGLRAQRTPIRSDGPDAIRSDIDVDEILRVWRENGIPGYASNYAGGFMCNMSLYSALATCKEMGLRTRCGFIHVPLTPGQVQDPEREPSMDLELQVRAVELAITICVHDAEAA